jgi:hypothetical protein
MWTSGLSLRSRSAIAVLTCLLLLAVVMMPVQIRPAAYNQRDPAAVQARRPGDGADAAGRGGGVLDDGDDATGVAGTRPGADRGDMDEDDPTYLLNLYVVFHRTLDASLFSDLRVAAARPDGASGLNVGSLSDVVLGGNNGVTFVACNKDIPKSYNASLPLFKHRVVNEWETKGFTQYTGAQYGSVFNEFGAMASIFHSGWTYRSLVPALDMQIFNVRDERDRTLRAVLRNGLDDAFVAVLQFDMRLTDRVVAALRRRIRATRLPSQFVPPPDPVNVMARGRDARVSRAVKLSRMHAGAVAEAPAPRGAVPKCCVFYAVNQPMAYVLKRNDRTTKKLLALYNSHFLTTYSYDDLAPMAIIDAFVIPFFEFNRLVPFLELLMRAAVAAGAQYNSTARAAALRELEQALALYLGLMGRDAAFRYVMVPLRHEPASRRGLG